MPSEPTKSLVRVTREIMVARPKAALQEAVIVAASAVHGLRVGLAPSNVDRLADEAKRETKRVRRARKAEVKAAVAFYRQHGGQQP